MFMRPTTRSSAWPSRFTGGRTGHLTLSQRSEAGHLLRVLRLDTGRDLGEQRGEFAAADADLDQHVPGALEKRRRFIIGRWKAHRPEGEARLVARATVEGAKVSIASAVT